MRRSALIGIKLYERMQKIDIAYKIGIESLELLLSAEQSAVRISVTSGVSTYWNNVRKREI